MSKFRKSLWLFLPIVLLLAFGSFFHGIFPYNGLWYHEDSTTHARDYVVVFWYRQCTLTISSPSSTKNYACSYEMKGPGALLSCTRSLNVNQGETRFFQVESHDNGGQIVLTETNANWSRAEGNKAAGTTLVRQGSR